MKKLVVIMLLVMVVFGVTSCSTTYDKKMLMTGVSKMTTEPQAMWARPTEVTYEIMGDVEGTAEYKLLFGILPLGDAPKTEFSIFGNNAANSPGIKLAAYDACKTIGADGIYLTSVYTESKSGLFVNSELVTIKGKALKLVDLGTVDQERADTVRYLEAAGGLNQDNTAPNLTSGSAFSALSSLFTVK
ncbi:MAG: hypothetical protein PQJ61_13750 [Spirochaetales bacterium]|uniref:Lipoprotein n=1 Tax=Candidatus Thalassospirochaeta sargassi TaxID=3119039 RepID=A0AAJ1MPH1_9SPIO|nr:hypothetical protein [Spirochaetales bacterium]